MPAASTRRTPSNIISLDDFSAGIVQRVNSPSATDNSPAPLGSASINNTYGCISLPGGGLGALPKSSSTLAFTDRLTSNLAGGTTARTTGFCLFGPIYATSDTPRFFPQITSATPFEIHLGYAYESGGNQTNVWRKYPYYSNDNSVALNSETSTATGSFAPTYFTVSSMNHDAPESFGYPVVVGSWVQNRTPSESDDWTYIYPDPTDATTAATDTPYNLGASISSQGIVLSHQSRIVVLGRSMALHGANNAHFVQNERVYWTTANDYEIEVAAASQFGLESPYGYGAWGSLTSSDLLLIKHDGGGYLIQGDLNTPIVRRFPSIQGTMGIETIGAASPVGFVYGVKNDGIYTWQGGDASLLLSPQMEDGFWHSVQPIYGFGGQFKTWGDLILCPNNYVFDIKTNAWWRIESPSTRVYHCWQIDPFNNVAYGLRTTFTDSSGVYAAGFSPNTPASIFSWQSQPFGLAERRRFRIREVLLTVQGEGSITTTFISDEGAGSVISNPNSPAFSTVSPLRVRLGCNVVGNRLQMLLVSSHASSGAAPIIYSVDLVVEEISDVAVS